MLAIARWSIDWSSSRTTIHRESDRRLLRSSKAVTQQCPIVRATCSYNRGRAGLVVSVELKFCSRSTTFFSLARPLLQRHVKMCAETPSQLHRSTAFSQVKTFLSLFVTVPSAADRSGFRQRLLSRHNGPQHRQEPENEQRQHDSLEGSCISQQQTLEYTPTSFGVDDDYDGDNGGGCRNFSPSVENVPKPFALFGSRLQMSPKYLTIP